MRIFHPARLMSLFIIVVVCGVLGGCATQERNERGQTWSSKIGELIGEQLKCLRATEDDSYHAPDYCNHSDLARWGSWKKLNPHMSGRYERDLFSGRIYRYGECPRNDAHVFCLD